MVRVELEVEGESCTCIIYYILYYILLLYYYNIHLYNTGARHQLPVVLPDHELGADDGGADNALQLQRAVLAHVDVRTPEYSHLVIILKYYNIKY